jgi:uncharacterized membrane protein
MASTASVAVKPRTKSHLPKGIALAVILLVALGFVLRYVFRYYLNFNETAFTDPIKGAANYWMMRGWLLLHITGGMVALLSGPFQFSSRIRKRYLTAHRMTGRVYLIAVCCGALASIRLAIGTTFGWAWGVGLLALAAAWLTTSGMAYYAVRQRQIQIHREWMVRSYIVTFGFVSFRMLNDMGPTSHLQPAGDRALTFIWACWVLPLLAAEVWMQLSRMRQQAR